MSEHRPYLNIGPGEFIKEELEIRGWKQSDVAEIAGLSGKSISQIINNKQSITVETARLLSKVFGQSPQYWLNLDTNYRLRLNESLQEDDLIEIKSLIYKYMPIQEMVKKGWIKSCNTTKELIEEIKDFWEIEDIDFSFLDKQILPNFRKSAAFNNFNQYHALTWFNMARKCAKSYKAGSYDIKRLSELASVICSYSRKDNGVEIFLDELKIAGVKFFVLRHLSKTYTDAATFWDDMNPVITYTCRHDRTDNFWFTIAHEIGHVMLHLDDHDAFFIDEDNRINTNEEKEADRYANDILKVNEIMKFFDLNSVYISEQQILDCEETLEIDASIIVGVLQHFGKLKRTHLNKFKSKVSSRIHSDYRPLK